MTGAVRVGVVGAGAVAARHVRVLGELGAHIVAVADTDSERAEALASSAGAQSVANVEGVLDAGVDAVYVCVPPFAHGSIEDQVVEARVALFVEKPLGIGVDHAEELARRIGAAGLVTGTGYHWRNLDTLTRARGLLEGGGPYLASAWWIDCLPPPEWWPRRSGSGGQVVEQATHVIDVLRALLGEMDVIDARPLRSGHAGPVGDPEVVDDATVALMRSADGSLVTLTTSCLAPSAGRRGVEVLGPGTFVALSEQELIVTGGPGAGRWEPTVDPRVEVDRAFLRAVVAGDPTAVPVSYAEALRTHRLAVAIAAAAAASSCASTVGGDGPVANRAGEGR